MRKIQVNASSSYNVIIEKDALLRVGEYCLDALGGTCRVCILTDTNVAPLYLDKVKKGLLASGFDTLEFIIESGEASKSTENLVWLVEFMAENRLTRKDVLVALGGGVVGDLGGFAAAVYLRGIRFVQLPTTLLAATDSSVGGKTAVDLKAGKNLMGAFYQPTLVICDYNTLDTLDAEVFSDGCAEVIKYGVIGNRKLFYKLQNGIAAQIEEIIADCVQMKADIVEEDEHDNGKRQLLNLGHTVGHAIEVCSEFEISHGRAVAMGMAIISKAAYKLGYCKKEDVEEIIALLEKEGLPTECPYGADELFSVATADKKRAGDEICVVIPFGIGECRLVRIPVSELCGLIAKGLE